MRNRQVGPDDAAGVLAGLVERVTYKPGWTFRLEEVSRGQGCEGLTLLISAPVVDSFNPDTTVEVCHLMQVPAAAFNERSWRRWILDCILNVEQHETLEWYRVDGDQPYFPGHGPGQAPYPILEIQSRDEAHAPAVPWSGGPATSEHFA